MEKWKKIHAVFDKLLDKLFLEWYNFFIGRIEMKKMGQWLKSFWIGHKKLLGETLAVIAVGALIFWKGFRCPIKLFTGISCPGCGMTRAIRAALRLNFAAAFHYHPLWALVPVFCVLYWILRRKKAKRCADLLVAVGCALLLSVYVCRLLLLPQEIVVWNPESGLFARLLEAIRSFFLFE